jgi:hypothetical protein
MDPDSNSMQIAKTPFYQHCWWLLGVTLLLGGCEYGEKSPDNRLDLVKAVEVIGPHPYLATVDLNKFQVGRSRSAILADLQWRSGSVSAGEIQGKRVFAMTYVYTGDGSTKGPTVTFDALFLDNKFEKFVQEKEGWTPQGEFKLGNPIGLRHTMELKAIGSKELQQELKAAPAPEHADPGLTAAFLRLRPALQANPATRLPTDKDYQRNADLRSQFNAARLDLGMSEAKVASVLKAKPLEVGKADAGSYAFYGSNEFFNVSAFLRFQNILVVFRDGKAISIENCGATDDWRERLPLSYVDLPKKPRRAR